MEKYYPKKNDFHLRLVIIYTGDVKSVESLFETNCITLRMDQAFLSHIDGKTAFDTIFRKVQSGSLLEDDDLMKLVILPLAIPGSQGSRNCWRR